MNRYLDLETLYYIKRLLYSVCDMRAAARKRAKMLGILHAFSLKNHQNYTVFLKNFGRCAAEILALLRIDTKISPLVLRSPKTRGNFCEGEEILLLIVLQCHVIDLWEGQFGQGTTMNEIIFPFF